MASDKMLGSFDQKSAPEDNDLLVEYDASASKVKNVKFGGVWNWIVKKLTSAVINELQTSSKNVVGAINELNSNIIPLEEASNKAKKYIEYKDRLSNIEVAVIAKEIKDLNFEYQEGKKRIEELENEITKVSTDSSTYDIDILKYKDKLKEVRDNINKSQVFLIDLSKKEEKITSDIRLLQERNKYKGEESLISNNIITLKEDILSIKNKLTNYNNDIEVLDNKISNINNNINEYKSKIDNLIVRKNNINNNIVKNNRDIDSSTYKIDYLENNLNKYYYQYLYYS